MPRAPEIPTVHRALDSALAADGGPLDAHTLREVALNANRELCKGEMLASWSFRGQGQGIEDILTAGTLTITSAEWVPLPLVVVPKKPGLALARLDAVARLPSGNDAQLALSTIGRSFHRSQGVTPAQRLNMSGTGNFGSYGPLDDIPLRADLDHEDLQVWIRTMRTGMVLSDTLIYGGVNDFLVTDFGLYRCEKDPATTDWNVGGSTIAGDRLQALFYQTTDGGQRLYLGARTIVENYADKFFFRPAWMDDLPVGTRCELRGGVTTAARVWIAGISVWAKDRTS